MTIAIFGSPYPENSKNTIYKYNVNSNVFMDTINVEGNVKDINFY